MTDQPFMKFEIQERVKHFKSNVSFKSLSTLEVHPIVKVYDSLDRVDISGHLVVSGEFAPQVNQADWEEQYEQSDGIHYGELFNSNPELETFQYQIPLSIQVDEDRVMDIEQVFVVIDYFDYDILSEEEIEVNAQIKILGIHPDVKQDTPIEFNTYDDEDDQSFNQPPFNEKTAYYQQEYDQSQNDYYQAEYTPDQSQWYPESHSEINQEAEQNENVELETSGYETSEEDVTQQEHFEPVDETNEVNSGSDQAEEVYNDKVIPFPGTEEALANHELYPEGEILDPDGAQNVMEEEETGAAKVKIGFKAKDRGESSKTTREGNPLYSLLKKELQGAKTVETQGEETTSEKMEEDSLPENADLLKVQQQNELDESSSSSSSSSDVMDSDDRITENVDRGTKKMLFSLLKGNEEKRIKMKMYFVQKEESLDDIATKYEINVKDLIKYNRLESSTITQGQILYIPIEG